MRNIVAVLLFFAICTITFVSSGSDGGKTIKTDYGGIELSIDHDALNFVADEATVSTDIVLKETGTFERKEEASPITYDFTFSPFSNDAEPRSDSSQHFDPNQGTTKSGHNSIEDARLKIVLPLRC